MLAMNHLIDTRSAMVSRLEIAVLVSAVMAVAGCGGSSTASPTATSAPSATLTAAIDPCLVGTWTTVAENQNSPANDEQITYAGGDGEVFTIDAQGGVTIDAHAAKKLVFESAGQTFSAVVAGTGRGTLTTTTNGTRRSFDFVPSADDTRTIHSFDSTGTELGPARPDPPFSAVYTCAPGQFTFYKTAVNYMVDGPIVTLKSGSANASSTAIPTPS
jgi:hypothetical protein